MSPSTGASGSIADIVTVCPSRTNDVVVSVSTTSNVFDSTYFVFRVPSVLIDIDASSASSAPVQNTYFPPAPVEPIKMSICSVVQ